MEIIGTPHVLHMPLGYYH